MGFSTLNWLLGAEWITSNAICHPKSKQTFPKYPSCIPLVLVQRSSGFGELFIKVFLFCFFFLIFLLIAIWLQLANQVCTYLIITEWITTVLKGTLTNCFLTSVQCSGLRVADSHFIRKQGNPASGNIRMPSLTSVMWNREFYQKYIINLSLFYANYTLLRKLVSKISENKILQDFWHCCDRQY